MDTTPLDLRHVRFEGTPAARCSPTRRPFPQRPSVAVRSVTRDATHLLPEADFSRWLLTKAGLNADIYRPEALQRRVAACLRALKVTTVEGARDLLCRRPERVSAAISSMLIGVTDFMRDPRVFDAMRVAVLPELATRCGPVRAWSAACSSGPELYSMAILLAEHGLLERSRLLGTDCRREAIAQAQTGVYSASELKWLPPPTVAQYFQPADGQWRVVERLRQRVEWKVADVWTRTEDGPWDVILWRNVAIYLNEGPARDILARLVDALAPGGFLVLGKAERATGHRDLKLVSPAVYQKQANEYA